MKLSQMIATLDPSVPFKKHTATIHIEANLTATEHKLLNILYKCAFETQSWDGEHYYVKLSDVKDFLGRAVMDRSDIKENLDNLLTARISWNIFSQDQKNKADWEELSSYGTTTFISGWHYLAEHSCIEFTLSEYIKKIIKNPNIYTHIDLSVQKLLSSKYEIIFYELLSDELSRSRSASVITRMYSIGDLLRIFGASPSSYLNEFREFRRHCIKRPIEEINRLTDITVEINDTVKVRNKIVAYQFKVNKKDAVSSIQQELPLLSGPEQTDPEHEEEIFNYESNYIVIEELAELFNNLDTAKKIYDRAKAKYAHIESDSFTEELIRENIEYTKKSEKSIKNFLGYLRMAIEHDYAQYESKYKKELEELLKAEEKAAQAKIRAAQAEIEEERHQAQIAKAEKERQAEISKFLKSVNMFEHPSLWQNCSEYIRKKEGEGVFLTWFGTAQLFVDPEMNFYLVAPNKFAADYIKEYYIGVVKESLAENKTKFASFDILASEAIKERFLK